MAGAGGFSPRARELRDAVLRSTTPSDQLANYSRMGELLDRPVYGPLTPMHVMRFLRDPDLNPSRPFLRDRSGFTLDWNDPWTPWANTTAADHYRQFAKGPATAVQQLVAEAAAEGKTKIDPTTVGRTMADMLRNDAPPGVRPATNGGTGIGRGDPGEDNPQVEPGLGKGPGAAESTPKPPGMGSEGHPREFPDLTKLPADEQASLVSSYLRTPEGVDVAEALKSFPYHGAAGLYGGAASAAGAPAEYWPALLAGGAAAALAGRRLLSRPARKSAAPTGALAFGGALAALAAGAYRATAAQPPTQVGYTPLVPGRTAVVRGQARPGVVSEIEGVGPYLRMEVPGGGLPGTSAHAAVQSPENIAGTVRRALAGSGDDRPVSIEVSSHAGPGGMSHVYNPSTVDQFGKSLAEAVGGRGGSCWFDGCNTGIPTRDWDQLGDETRDLTRATLGRLAKRTGLTVVGNRGYSVGDANSVHVDPSLPGYRTFPMGEHGGTTTVRPDGTTTWDSRPSWQVKDMKPVVPDAWSGAAEAAYRYGPAAAVASAVLAAATKGRPAAGAGAVGTAAAAPALAIEAKARWLEAAAESAAGRTPDYLSGAGHVAPYAVLAGLPAAGWLLSRHLRRPKTGDRTVSPTAKKADDLGQGLASVAERLKAWALANPEAAVRAGVALGIGGLAAGPAMGAGGLYGAATAPAGQAGRGLARGALTGLGTVGGAAAGAALHGAVGNPDDAASLALSTLGGGLGGNVLSRAALGPAKQASHPLFGGVLGIARDVAMVKAAEDPSLLTKYVVDPIKNLYEGSAAQDAVKRIGSDAGAAASTAGVQGFLGRNPWAAGLGMGALAGGGLGLAHAATRKRRNPGDWGSDALTGLALGAGAGGLLGGAYNLAGGGTTPPPPPTGPLPTAALRPPTPGIVGKALDAAGGVAASAGRGVADAAKGVKDFVTTGPDSAVDVQKYLSSVSDRVNELSAAGDPRADRAVPLFKKILETSDSPGKLMAARELAQTGLLGADGSFGGVDDPPWLGANMSSAEDAAKAHAQVLDPITSRNLGRSTLGAAGGVGALAGVRAATNPAAWAAATPNALAELASGNVPEARLKQLLADPAVANTLRDRLTHLDPKGPIPDMAAIHKQLMGVPEPNLAAALRGGSMPVTRLGEVAGPPAWPNGPHIPTEPPAPPAVSHLNKAQEELYRRQHAGLHPPPTTAPTPPKPPLPGAGDLVHPQGNVVTNFDKAPHPMNPRTASTLGLSRPQGALVAGPSRLVGAGNSWGTRAGLTGNLLRYAGAAGIGGLTPAALDVPPTTPGPPAK